ncbi:MAG: DUF2149 domain-containing protein [Bryobacterales bacterium]|nr:DUF2149 domain-containing protein [Bryobacterales bacterium]
MFGKKRHWDELMEDDPAAGLLNLFDVWIAFAAALLLATVSYYSKAGISPDMVQKNNVRIERYRPTNEKLSGNGERLGTAYRLASGEVVYVPDK